MEVVIAVTLCVGILFLIVIIKSRLISKLLDFICRTSTYKKYFAGLIIKYSKKGKDPASPLYAPKKRMFEEITSKLEELPGDVLEIGSGSGASLEWLQLPEGCSLVVIDNNPHFVESFKGYLSKYPEIKLKEYLVQSAVDMRNIPDNTFSVVFVQDVLCSIEEYSLGKMMKEIKRVLKPGGHFYFIEHVLDKPGTWRRIAQKLVSGWSGVWPRLFGNCHCDRETWQYIQETGFRSVTISDYYTSYPSKKKLAIIILVFFTRRFVSGHAKK